MAQFTTSSKLKSCTVEFTFDYSTKKFISIAYEYPSNATEKRLRINVTSLSIVVNVGPGTNKTTYTIPVPLRPTCTVSSKNGFESYSFGEYQISLGI